jgi:hypothetical protein
VADEGKTILLTIQRDKPIYPTGQIELQNHGNTLYFKNIYLREIAGER